jgi:hypothetical protein
MDYDPSISRYPDEVYVLVSVPPKNGSGTNPLGLNERAECMLRGGADMNAVFSVSNFPLPMPRPKEINYQILSTPTMGLGMFATRDLNIGDLILAERPLLFIPRVAHRQVQSQQTLNYDETIEPCFQRLTADNRAAYGELSNSHTSDGSGPLLGVARTNGCGVELREGSRYTAIYKEISRINHRYNIHIFRSSGP